MLIKFTLLLQVALRIRPVSDAEQDEAATIVAHRLDEQVRRDNVPTATSENPLNNKQNLVCAAQTSPSFPE